MAISSTSSRSIRAAVLAAAAVFGTCAAHSGVEFPACSQSLINGTWQANFYLAQVNHGFSCAIDVSSDGTLSFGNCTTAKSVTITKPPSGTLKIDRSCHVTGSITYDFSDDQWGGGPAQESLSLWRSLDGSRLSGNRHFVCCDGIGAIPQDWVVPFELVAGQ